MATHPQVIYLVSNTLYVSYTYVYKWQSKAGNNTQQAKTFNI